MAISGGFFTLKLTRISLLSTSSFTNVFRSFQLQRRQQQHFYLQTMASSAAALSEDAVEKISAPYGSWKSPITADVVSGGDKRLGGTAVDSNGRLFWLESRPTESGRSVLVMEAESPGGEARDITPKEFNVRTLAQEYGGGAFSISGDTVVFSNYKDQRLYKQSISSKDTLPVPITPDYGRPVVSFADGVFDWRLNRFITVMEDGRESSVNPVTTIATVSITDDCAQEAKLLVSGNDFYAFPRIDSTGTRVAWIEWSHPNMPWDRSELWVGYIDDNGDLYKRICVAGHDPKIVEAPSEPKWSPKGELYFVTDRHNGFWNLYKWNESNNEAIPLHPLDAEFTRPLWVFGINSYDFLPSEENRSFVACSYRQNGSSHLGILDEEQKSLTLLDVPYTDINNITSSSHYFFLEGASGAHPSSIAKVTLDAHKSKVDNFEVVWSSSPNCSRYASYFSFPEFIRFPTVVPGQEAYAYYYPPSNPYFKADSEEKPPLLLKSHGGPTGESRGILNMSIQYWTSRGWAFVDVNYGGSTGYGRDFRERLLGKWGIVDVDDCCSCARFLVDSGKADGNRLCITGGSAGGYTTLAALAFKDTFKAGASLYGVADLSLLRAEIPKFESHYIDKLVGTDKDFIERSPINYVDRFSCPIILFQGLEDKVVPPGQSRKIYKALKEKGLPVALVEYEGEQHGFRKAENIKFTLEQQMHFFARTVGNFKVADDITPIRIDNFD